MRYYCFATVLFALGWAIGGGLRDDSDNNQLWGNNERKERNHKMNNQLPNQGNGHVTAKKLASDHWDYVESLLLNHRVYDFHNYEKSYKSGFIDGFKLAVKNKNIPKLSHDPDPKNFHYESALVHGYKHGKDAIRKAKKSSKVSICPHCGMNNENMGSEKFGCWNCGRLFHD